MDFVARVDAARPAPGQLALFWLGQAGFLIKTAQGALILIDPYFSDYVMRAFPEEGLGFKRLSPAPCGADELKIDVLLISHEHADHFDQDAIGTLLKNPATQVYANAPVAHSIAQMGLGGARVHALQKGDAVRLDACTLTPVDADHGSLAPDALGFLLDFGFASVYYAGDTALTLDRLAAPLAARPQVAILPINGAYGNLNGREAARYAGLLQAKMLVPCHFWTFPLHHGDPQTLIDAMPAEAPDCALRLLCQGEGIYV